LAAKIFGRLSLLGQSENHPILLQNIPRIVQWYCSIDQDELLPRSWIISSIGRAAPLIAALLEAGLLTLLFERWSDHPIVLCHLLSKFRRIIQEVPPGEMEALLLL
jgi:hypothetical protein